MSILTRALYFRNQSLQPEKHPYWQLIGGSKLLQYCAEWWCHTLLRTEHTHLVTKRHGHRREQRFLAILHGSHSS